LRMGVVVALGGLDRVWRWSPARPLRMVASALLLAGLVWRLPAGADDYAWGVQNVNAMQVQLGRWLAAHTPPNTLVGLNDVGALSYFGERRMIDLMGLATPEILPYRRLGEAGRARPPPRGGPGGLRPLPARVPPGAARPAPLPPVPGGAPPPHS